MEQPLKERLVGAVVLVCAAVIFVPMILSGPREPGVAAGEDLARPDTASPRPPQRGFASRVVPLEGPAVGTSAPAAPAQPVTVPSEASRPPPPKRVAATSPGPARSVEPVGSAASPAAKAPAVAPAPPPPARSGWVVQLGSFSNARNAIALRDRLRSGGHAAFVETSPGERGQVSRVFVGPERDRSRAEGVKKRLREETKLDGFVVRYPG